MPVETLDRLKQKSVEQLVPLLLATVVCMSILPWTVRILFVVAILIGSITLHRLCQFSPRPCLDAWAAVLLAPYSLKRLAGVPSIPGISNVLFATTIAGLSMWGGRRVWCLLERLPQLKKVAAWKLTLLLAGVYAIMFAVLASMRHMSFTTEMVDLGFMDQAIWNTLHGRLLVVTTELGRNVTRLATHVEPIYVLLSPLYLVIDDVRVLFWVQSCAVAAGAIPLFGLAQKKLDSDTMAAAVVLVYLALPATHLPLLFDFHGDVLAIPFLLWAIHNRGKPGWRYWAPIFGSLLCKEYTALALVGFGSYLVLAEKAKYRGVVTLALGLLWFAVTQGMIIPHFRPANEVSLVSVNYAHIGGSKGVIGIITCCIKNPWLALRTMVTLQNLEAGVYFLAPLLFLPLLGWKQLLAASPLFAKDLLFGMDIGTHHSASTVPFLMYAVLCALSKMETTKRKLCLVSIVTATCLSHVAVGESPFSIRFWKKYKNEYMVSPRERIAHYLLSRIPPTAPVTASGRLAPHLCHREWCFVPPNPSDLNKIQYALFDTYEQRDRDWSPSKAATAIIAKIEASANWQKLHEAQGLLLYKRNPTEANEGAP